MAALEHPVAGAGVYRRFRHLLDVQVTSRAELFGPSQRVGPRPDPLLPPAGYQDRLAYESYLSQKPRNEHLGGGVVPGIEATPLGRRVFDSKTKT